MKKYLQKIRNEAEHIRLTSAEKSAMRRAVFGALSPKPVKSPYVFMSFTSVWGRAFAAVMLFVLVGGGTASAAQGALPGDLLYPVKVSITEKLEAALAPSVAAKAEVEAKFAGRRVEEAQSLASQGRLDAKSAESLAAQFEAHAKNAEDLAEEAEAEEPGTAVEVKTSLASALETRGKILAKIGNDSKNESTKKESRGLATRVIARATGPARIEAASMFAAAPQKQEAGSEGARAVSLMATEAADTALQHLAAKLQMRAAAELSNTKKLFDETKDKLDATSTVQLLEKLELADKSMSKGSTLLGSGAYGEAAVQFKSVLVISARLSALLDAEEKFDNGIIRELLNHASGDGKADAEIEVEGNGGIEIKVIR